MRHSSIRLGAALAAAALSGAAQAAVVAETLPYGGSPDWSTVVFSGTSMTTDGATSTLTTTTGAGVWFGYRTAAPPAWAPGTSAEGNYLSMALSFSADAEQWNAYLYDQTHYAEFLFAPTGCACYGAPVQQGVNIFFADGADAGSDLDSLFVALDLTEVHTYEFLLKDGQVSYRIDGVAYSGAAHAAAFSPLLVIGDGSGGTPTGVGSMYVHGVSFDNAPAADRLETTAAAVPEPATWTLMIAGFGLAGATLRRRVVRPA